MPKSRETTPLPGQPPTWVQMQPNETPEQWKDRIWAEFMQFQLSQGFTHDIVALKRHELVSKHLWPIKQELDIGSKQPDWLRYLTDEQLMLLKAMKDSALQRKQNHALTDGVTVSANGNTPQEGGQ